MDNYINNKTYESLCDIVVGFVSKKKSLKQFLKQVKRSSGLHRLWMTKQAGMWKLFTTALFPLSVDSASQYLLWKWNLSPACSLNMNIHIPFWNCKICVNIVKKVHFQYSYKKKTIRKPIRPFLLLLFFRVAMISEILTLRARLLETRSELKLVWDFTSG